MNNPVLFENCGKETPSWIRTEITLLDLFAGMAMQGFVAGWRAEVGDDPKDNVHKITEDSYELARVMLIERERFTQGESNA